MTEHLIPFAADLRKRVPFTIPSFNESFRPLDVGDFDIVDRYMEEFVTKSVMASFSLYIFCSFHLSVISHVSIDRTIGKTRKLPSLSWGPTTYGDLCRSPTSESPQSTSMWNWVGFGLLPGEKQTRGNGRKRSRSWSLTRTGSFGSPQKISRNGYAVASFSDQPPAPTNLFFRQGSFTRMEN